MFASIEGELTPLSEAKIPISDRGFLFGDGAFTTVRVENGTPLYLAQHLQKLYAQCDALNMQIPPIPEEHVWALIAANRAEKGIWRLKVIISGGDCPDVMLPRRTGRIVLTLLPYEEVEKIPLRLCVHTQTAVSNKSLAYLPRLIARHEALQSGYDDCVTLSAGEVVLETAYGNLFWVTDTTLYTPHPKLPLYFGVTIERVCEEASQKGLCVKYVELQLEELPDAHYYRTNSMGGIWPILSIGARVLATN